MPLKNEGSICKPRAKMSCPIRYNQVKNKIMGIKNMKN
jgi:hypothetical protein